MTAMPARDGSAQSLATGTAGTALLEIERALTTGEWTTAHQLLRQATAVPVSSADQAGLYYGAPAISFLLHAAQSDGRTRYRATVHTLDGHVERLVHRRVTTATRRTAAGVPPTFAEYDLFYGLTGLAALLLRYRPASDALGRALTYLAALTRPRPDQDGRTLPGWWVAHDPDPALPTPGGHANLGMAHGAAGILAVLALATARGAEVDGQHAAIEELTELFDRYRCDGADGPWWPQWLTRDHLLGNGPSRPGPARTSWCYGSPGIARARQLAALATADHKRREQAERDLAGSLSPTHLNTITDPGLCHGAAGIYQTAWRAAQDATGTTLTGLLPAIAATLTDHADAAQPCGLLTGATGVALALETAQHNTPPHSGWDACLLIS
jgi:class I lanthipeptide synthase